MFPIHLGAHWCLAVVHVSEKKITYLDSLKNDNALCLQVLYEYLVQESHTQGSEFDPAAWHSSLQKNIPE